jgi:hypothetical protein
MRTECQKHDCFVRQTRAKTIATFGNAATFFANDKDDAKVAINPNTPTAAQIQVTASIIEILGVVIRILKHSLNFAIHARAQIGIAPIVLAE